MANLDEIQEWLEQNLSPMLAASGTPAASVGVLCGDEIIVHAAGILSTATGVEATADSLFQIGSITKPWTATLIMQLVQDELLELDATVRTYLPDFRLADESAAASITIRQLLSHTAGFEGDVLADVGRDDDSVKAFVETLADSEQLCPPGDLYSYNNAAYCVLGRVVEVLRGRPFDECLQEHLIDPLGLVHCATSPYEAILHRVAVGHVQDTMGAAVRPSEIWALPRAYAPAGAMLAMRAKDLLEFARIHLRAPRSSTVAAILTDESARAMQTPQVQVPYLGIQGMSFGLGWAVFDWPGGPVIGHNGGTIGQTSYLLAVLDREIAITILTNAERTFSLFTTVAGHVLRNVAGIEMPPFPRPPDAPGTTEAGRYIGRYASGTVESVVSQDREGKIWLEDTPIRESIEQEASTVRTELVRLRGDTLVEAEPDQDAHATYAFLGDDGHGRAKYLHSGRVSRRTLLQ